MRIPIKSIEIDGDVLVRDQLDESTVARYKEILDDLPPIRVMDIPDGRRVLTDGWHRLTAAVELGRPQIKGDIRSGSLEEAITEGATANAQHGRQMTAAERREAAKRLMRLKWSNAKIAKAVAMSTTWVGDIQRAERVREEVSEAAGLAERTVEAIATAPPKFQRPLVKSALKGGWTSDQTRDAVNVVKSNIPENRKRDVLAGRVNPSLARYAISGEEPRVSRDTIDEAERRLQSDAGYQAILTHREWHSLTLAIWQFRNNQDWANMLSHRKVKEVRQLLKDIADIRQFIDELEERARAQLKPRMEVVDG